MRRFRVRSQYYHLQPLLRAITVISSVAILATGVTFAALQSQASVLTGNSISTGTADLRISTNATSYGTTQSGFDFGDVVPGAAAVPSAGNSFYLKNYGSTALALTAGLREAPANADSVDLAKTYVTVTRVDTNVSQKLSLASLVTGGTIAPLPLTDTLDSGATAQYRLQVSMDTDAFTGQSADITGIDLVFSGTAVTN